MKKKYLSVFLSVLMALFVSSIAFADIDLDLDDEEERGVPRDTTGGYFTIKAGYDLNGKYDYDATLELSGFELSESEEYDIDNGFSFSAEFVGAINERAGFGAGISYQHKRSFDENTGGLDPKFNFLPIHGLFKFKVPLDNSITPFAVAHLGYNLLFGNDDFKGEDGDLSGGLYWGLGFGIIISDGIQVELLYSVNNGKVEESGIELELVGDPYSGYYYENIPYSYEEEFKYSKITLSVGYNFY
ncbi:MAG: hypothetical protein SVZ03_09490 [Spirochaetota bacterium]|nr:hypothetical protein [Spirochaetota bacterium]